MTYLKGVLETNITEILAVLEEFSEEMTDLHIQQGHTSEELAQTSESVAQLEVLSTGEKHYGKKRATAAITWDDCAPIWVPFETRMELFSAMYFI